LTKKRTDSFTEKRLLLRVLLYKESNDNDNKLYSRRNKDWNYNLYRRFISPHPPQEEDEEEEEEVEENQTGSVC
jgi:hypothetical protein